MSAKHCLECGAPLPSTVPGGLCSTCALRGALAAGDGDAPTMPIEGGVEPPAVAPMPGTAFRRFGDYELLEEIARGGMGVVYRARQVSLDRLVAVKMILAGEFATPQFVQRFRTEASAAAVLHHPNIVAIHEVGVHAGQHYFSMDFVDGPSLAQGISDLRFRISDFKRSVRWVKTIAEAVHYAHEQGILHRDLKPSNVLIDAHDQPRITDFGLAKRLEGETSLTLSGQMVGSPNFMPPEQATARHGKVGRYSDVYALGGILYHLLTARPPFQADSLEVIVSQVLTAEPVSPRLLNPTVPRDLETICLKCLEKEPSRRYATAQALADELGRFLRGEPIHARPLGPTGKVWRWCRRQPARAGLVAALILVFMLGLTGVLWQWRQTQRANVAAEHREYAANIGLVQSLIGDQEFQRAREILDARTSERYRSWEWGWLQRQCHQDLMTLSGESPAGISAFAIFDPATRLLATDGGRSNTVLLWDFATGQKLRTLVGHTGWVFRAAFSRDGRQLATSSPWDRVARIWNVATGREWPQLEHPEGVHHIAYSPDGKRLLTACWDGRVRVWDTERWTLLDESPPYGDHVFCAEFSPDGRRIAYAGGYHLWANSRVTSVRIWNLESREVRSLEGHTGCVTGLAWNPKGDRLASCAWDGRVILWDVASGLRQTLEPGARPRAMLQLSFSPDGHSLAVAGSEFTAHPWVPVLDVPSLQVRCDWVQDKKVADFWVLEFC